MVTITAKGTLEKLGDDAKVGSGWVVRLPESASKKLPSKGMSFIEGTIDGDKLATAVEPDGKGSHWFALKGQHSISAARKEGNEVNLSFQALKDWPEPKVPKDVRDALDADTDARTAWDDITPAARWDWIRWIGAGKKADTRVKRIKDTISKLNDGKRRPCCFNRNECTLTDA